MKTIRVGGVEYRLAASASGPGWIAHAQVAATGRPFGIECAGTTELEAVDRLARWLDWQHEHSIALEEVQAAERAYHRAIAGSAFANPTEGPTAVELQKESLEALEAARRRLDEIRGRRPH